MKNEILPTKENLQNLTQKELQAMYYEYFNIEISLIKVNGDIFSNVHIHNEHIFISEDDFKLF